MILHTACPDIWCDMALIFLAEALDDVDLPGMIDSSRQPIDEMMLQCKFRGKEINCSDYFVKSMSVIGWCYTFNRLTLNTQNILLR